MLERIEDKGDEDKDDGNLITSVVGNDELVDETTVHKEVRKPKSNEGKA